MESTTNTSSTSTTTTTSNIDNDILNDQNNKKRTIEESNKTDQEILVDNTNNIVEKQQKQEEEDESGGDDDEIDSEDDKKKKKGIKGQPCNVVIPPLLTKEQLIELQDKTKVTTNDSKKKKVALCIGYSGKNYKGMQKNPGYPTIEDELEIAIFKTGAISPDNMYFHRKIDWVRCARTDKGVSALRNMVSAKLLVDPPSFEELVVAINSHLPEDIRVFGMKRVNNSFHAKNCVDGRSYLYLTPVSAFEPVCATKPRTLPYVFDQVERKRLNSVLALYCGTKLYHNYTNRKESTDPSATRTITSFECTEPFNLEGVAEQYVQLNVRGQSFMMHQIRKMVGFSMSLMRLGVFNDYDNDVDALAYLKKLMDSTFMHRQVGLPMAPGEGLMLDRCLFDMWTKKFKSVHGDLLFSEVDNEINQFKLTKIFSEMARAQVESQCITGWVSNSLDPYPLPIETMLTTYANPPQPPPRQRSSDPKSFNRRGSKLERVPEYRRLDKKYLDKDGNELKDKKENGQETKQEDIKVEEKKKEIIQDIIQEAIKEKNEVEKEEKN